MNFYLNPSLDFQDGILYLRASHCGLHDPGAARFALAPGYLQSAPSALNHCVVKSQVNTSNLTSTVVTSNAVCGTERRRRSSLREERRRRDVLQNYQAEVGGKVYYAQDRMSEYLGIDTDETLPQMSYDLKDTLKFALQGRLGQSSNQYCGPEVSVGKILWTAP